LKNYNFTNDNLDKMLKFGKEIYAFKQLKYT
jgi:hypothetical protein